MAHRKIKSRIKKDIPVIILAGGQGKRFGSTFKQFLWVNGKPLLFYSLEKFLKFPHVGAIIFVVPFSRMEYTKRLLKKTFGERGKKIHIVKGGGNRRESTYCGLAYLVETLQRASDYIFSLWT